MPNAVKQKLHSTTKLLRFNPLRPRLAHKVIFLMVALILIASSVTTYIVYTMGLNALKKEIENKLAMTASNAVVALDVEKLKTIRSHKDEGNDDYLYLQKKLQAIKKASLGRIRFVYTVAKKGNRYVYILDAAPIQDKKNHSYIGQPFDIKKYPVAKLGFARPVAENKPYKDSDYKIWSQSGYAPIKDGNGNVLGMLGVDMDITTLKMEQRNMETAASAALLIALILAIVFGILVSTYLTKPIFTLIEGTRQVAEGNLDTIVKVSRRDEIGQLSDAFNTMIRDLKNSQEALWQYSAGLEEKVVQRTAELTQTNREVKDILDHISQAFFTIDRNLCFNHQHSKYAHTIFGDRPFAGRSILDLLFSDQSSEPDREDLESWLRMIFDQDFMTWEDLEPLQPFREMSVNVRGMEDREIVKFISVGFKPIVESGPRNTEVISKVMVIIEDITDKKQLEKKIEEKEKEYKDNIDQIVEIIKADRDLFNEFIAESREQLAQVEPKLIVLQEDRVNAALINDLFRIMHSIKGNALTFKLQRIAGEAHAMETCFASIRNNEIVLDDNLLNDCFEKLDRLQSIFGETLKIYEKITHGKSLDIGKTRTEQRLAEDGAVIKVKTETIARLTGLFQQLDGMIMKCAETSSDSSKAEFGAVQQLLTETKNELHALKKIPIGHLFTRFPRMIRDISSELGKKVIFLPNGNEIEVDKYVFDRVADPMIHLIRNALDHGIETPEERVLAGKPEEGTIVLHIEAEGSTLSIEVRDDGRGLNLDLIKASAVAKSLITPEKALGMSEEEISALIFSPGFSTNETITLFSGRGVGLDVVKNYIEDKLCGQVLVQNLPGQGLSITLKVPLSN